MAGISYRDAEALMAEIEKESRNFDEVVRIKAIIENSENETDSLVFDSLWWLRYTPLTLEILMATQIGMTVNALRKHASTDIRNMARTLVKRWGDMVDKWVSSTEALEEEGGTQNSVNPSVVDEEAGLPSPPLEDLSFLVPYDKSIQICNLLDGLDDD